MILTLCQSAFPRNMWRNLWIAPNIGAEKATCYNSNVIHLGKILFLRFEHMDFRFSKVSWWWLNVPFRGTTETRQEMNRHLPTRRTTTVKKLSLQGRQARNSRNSRSLKSIVMDKNPIQWFWVILIRQIRIAGYHYVYLKPRRRLNLYSCVYI